MSGIYSNKYYWGKLKAHLSTLSYGKCWYTEVHDIGSHYHVDHFRPKNKTLKLKRNCNIKTANSNESYWWLAFNWENYRYSASIPNTSKNSYFPLKNGTQPAKTKDNINLEWPGLLDPTEEDDVLLITFTSDGQVCPVCSNDENWDAIRVKLSIRVYDLNNISLVDARKVIQNDCKRRIENILETQRNYFINNDPTYRIILTKQISELHALSKLDAELSAVARNYIRSYPEDFIKNIAS